MLALYSGLSASLLRQLTYSTTRFAIYDVSVQYWSARFLQKYIYIISYISYLLHLYNYTTINVLIGSQAKSISERWANIIHYATSNGICCRRMWWNSWNTWRYDQCKNAEWYQASSGTKAKVSIKKHKFALRGIICFIKIGWTIAHFMHLVTAMLEMDWYEHFAKKDFVNFSVE